MICSWRIAFAVLQFCVQSPLFRDIRQNFWDILVKFHGLTFPKNILIIYLKFKQLKLLRLNYLYCLNSAKKEVEGELRNEI